MVWKTEGVELVSTAAPPVGWHHVVYTFDGTTHHLYVDGSESHTSTVAPDQGVVTAARLATFHKNDEFFRGSLDDVRIYDRPLDVAEIRLLAAGSE